MGGLNEAMETEGMEKPEAEQVSLKPGAFWRGCLNHPPC